MWEVWKILLFPSECILELSLSTYFIHRIVGIKYYYLMYETILKWIMENTQKSLRGFYFCINNKLFIIILIYHFNVINIDNYDYNDKNITFTYVWNNDIIIILDIM